MAFQTFLPGQQQKQRGTDKSAKNQFRKSSKVSQSVKKNKNFLKMSPIVNHRQKTSFWHSPYISRQ